LKRFSKNKKNSEMAKPVKPAKPTKRFAGILYIDIRVLRIGSDPVIPRDLVADRSGNLNVFLNVFFLLKKI